MTPCLIQIVALQSYYIGDYTSLARGRRLGIYAWRDVAVARGARVQFVPNVVFEATLRLVGRELVDVDGGERFQIGRSLRNSLMAAVADGRLVADGDRLIGVFTFEKHANQVHIAATGRMRGQQLADAGAVPDVTDLLDELPLPNDMRRR